MYVFINPEDVDPRDLRRAIRLLLPELPNLLGSNYSSFLVELDSLVQNGRNDELLSLFARFPNAYNKLHDFLCYLLAGGDLFGRSKTSPSSVKYTCPEGQHQVEHKKVRKRDVRGFPLCPIHNKPMAKPTETDQGV